MRLQEVAYGLRWVVLGRQTEMGEYLIYDKDLGSTPALRSIRALGHFGQLP